VAKGIAREDECSPASSEVRKKGKKEKKKKKFRRLGN